MIIGEFESLETYVRKQFEESVQVSETLRSFIDWRTLTENIELSGKRFTLRKDTRTVHVFKNGTPDYYYCPKEHGCPL